MLEKKQELEKRLQDVTGQLGTNKKTNKKCEILGPVQGCSLLFDESNYFHLVRVWRCDEMNAALV